MWTAIHNSSTSSSSLLEQKIYFDQINGADIVTRKLTDTKLDTSVVKDSLPGGDRVFPDGHFQTLIRETQRVAQVRVSA